jgi:FkbM family methyltransferase
VLEPHRTPSDAARAEQPSDTAGQGSPRAALERATDLLERGGSTPWDAPSRLGPIGRFARRTLRRALRPFEHRQREVDAALLDAVGELSRRIESGERAPSLELASELHAGSVVERKTRAGELWLRADDELVTPVISEHGLWEPEVSAFLVRRLRAGATFVDVGSNIGYFSILASPLVGPRGRVFAVEPDPSNLRVLRANLWRNRATNASVLPIAAWNERTQVSLMLQAEGGAGSWVTPDPREQSLHDSASVGVLVPAAPLDDLITGRLDVLKVDCELTDHLVVQGCERLLAANPEAEVVVEFFTRAKSHIGQGPEEILGYYRGLGFATHLLDDEGIARPAADEEIRAAGEFVTLILRRAAGRG